MIRSEKRLRLCAALIVANLVFIWGNSLLPGSVSGAFSDWVKEQLSMLMPWSGPDEGGGTGLLRKLAHFSEFALLGFLLSWLVGMLDRNRFLALAGGFLAACVDETIQRFVPDRGPSLWDVGIDTCGAAAGMMLLWLGYTVYKKRNHQYPLEEMNQ